MQPFWRDDIHFEGGAEFGTIEVSSMPFVHVPDVEDTGEYIRNLVTNVIDVQDELNNRLFAAENKANNEDGQVLCSGLRFVCSLSATSKLSGAGGGS
jgi:hypothetical protein